MSQRRAKTTLDDNSKPFSTLNIADFFANTAKPSTKLKSIEKIYVNPSVTRKAQGSLAEKLHQEIQSESELEKSYQTRTIPQKSSLESAKIFDQYCMEFINASKETKERVVSTISSAQNAVSDLTSAIDHFEDLEREAYRFEMDLQGPEESEKPAES